MGKAKNKIPKIILEYNLDSKYDQDKIRKLNYPTQEMDIVFLEWHFDIPIFNTDNEEYNLKPIDIINNPNIYKDKYEKIINSDLSYPITVMENKGRLIILDGIDKLVKYKLLGINKVLVKIIPNTEIENIK